MMSDLNQAPAHIQLAVDLIQLLESNDIPPQLALAALAVVKTDFETKLTNHDCKSSA